MSYGGVLGWQEWQFRRAQWATVQTMPAPLPTLTPPSALNTQAVATVLGLTTQGSVLDSAEPLTLRATVVARDSESRALLAGPDGERFYRAGERLPGGSLLRRIEPAHVVLWRQGREERLSLYPAGPRFLQPADTHRQAAASRHLRPTVETSRSE
ncbi:type II secretion system protein N [Pseudomonas sp. 18175]|uniref:type II secretion system protein N n=1 Tax=Pseudomonas sp. 18175 TaxID=3390056 RepID=UPI003D1AA723